MSRCIWLLWVTWALLFCPMWSAALSLIWTLLLLNESGLSCCLWYCCSCYFRCIFQYWDKGSVRVQCSTTNTPLYSYCKMSETVPLLEYYSILCVFYTTKKSELTWCVCRNTLQWSYKIQKLCSHFKIFRYVFCQPQEYLNWNELITTRINEN